MRCLVAAGATAVLLGCARDADRSAAPGAGDTEPPAVPSDPSDWTVTADGYGPVRIGMTVDQVRETLGRLLVPRDSIHPECDYLAIGPEGPEVLLMVVGGELVRLDVRDSAVTTAAGARIGSSAATIGRLYGADRVMATPHAYTDGQYLTVVPSGMGDDHRLVFETDGKRVTEYRAGMLPMVGWVEGCS